MIQDVASLIVKFTEHFKDKQPERSELLPTSQRPLFFLRPANLELWALSYDPEINSFSFSPKIQNLPLCQTSPALQTQELRIPPNESQKPSQHHFSSRQSYDHQQSHGKEELKKFALCGEDFSTAIMNDHMRIIHELQSFKATEKPAN